MAFDKLRTMQAAARRVRMMRQSIDFDRVVVWFVRSVAIIWLLAAAAKLSSLTADQAVMLQRDPVLGIRNAYLYMVMAELETIGACYLLFRVSRLERLVLLTIASFLFLGYRVIFGFIDPYAPCNCMGNVLSKIGLTAVASDRLAFAVVIYSSVGAGMCWLRLGHADLVKRSVSAEAGRVAVRLLLFIAGGLAALALGTLLTKSGNGPRPIRAAARVEEADRLRPVKQVETTAGKRTLYPSTRRSIGPIWASFEDAAAALDVIPEKSLVLLLTNRTDVRAYPLQFLDRQEIVFDRLDGETVLVTYCGLTHSPAVYKSTGDLNLLSFADSEYVLESNLVMKDSATSSLWAQLTGKCFAGLLSGKSLDELPSYLAVWKAAKDTFPKIKLMREPPGFRGQVNASRTNAGTSPQMTMPVPAYPVSSFDPVLPANEEVLGVVVNAVPLAIPVTAATDTPWTNRLPNVTLRAVSWLGCPVVERLTREGDWERVIARPCYWFAWYSTFTNTAVLSPARPRASTSNSL